MVQRAGRGGGHTDFRQRGAQPSQRNFTSGGKNILCWPWAPRELELPLCAVGVQMVPAAKHKTTFRKKETAVFLQ